MTNRTLAVIAAAALAALALPAAAQQPPAPQPPAPATRPPPVLGFYLGAGFGGAVLPFDEDDFLQVPGTASAVTSEEGSFAYKAFAGYRFHQNFALEAYYANLGDFWFQRNVTFPFGGTARADIKSSGWGIDALGIFPLPRNWSLFGKVGAFYSTTKTDYSSTGAVTFAPGTNLHPERKEWNFKVGFGGQYDINPNFAVRAEIETYINVGDDQTTGEASITMLSVSMVARF